MQPTEVQVERTLAALRDEPHQDSAGPDRTVGIPRTTLDVMLNELPAGLLEDLETPAPRDERVQEVRDRLEHGGDDLSSDELANRIVGRLVCDRLR